MSGESMTMPVSSTVPQLADVRAAADRIQGHAFRTPVLTSRTLDRLSGAQVFVKCENFQRVGAFKFRGAYNAACQLPPEQLARGVTAYSSGNHAQAVALAARELSSHAVILMPADAPASKVAAVKGYGAEVVSYDRYTQDRAALGEALAADRGLALIPPYEHPDVISGQGTVGLELLDEVGSLDVVMAPVGGGGLMAGVATAVTALQPGITMVGVEPETGDDQRRSLIAGKRIRIPMPRTIADGLAIDVPGVLTFSINSRLVSEIVLVSDAEIVEAMRFLFDRMKLVVEPSGATTLAAILAGRIDLAGKRVGVVISGGNIDVQRFVELLSAFPGG